MINLLCKKGWLTPSLKLHDESAVASPSARICLICDHEPCKKPPPKVRNKPNKPKGFEPTAKRGKLLSRRAAMRDVTLWFAGLQASAASRQFLMSKIKHRCLCRLWLCEMAENCQSIISRPAVQLLCRETPWLILQSHTFLHILATPMKGVLADK